MKTYAMGGFGCGNLGDEAIFEAMKLEIPDLIQIYVNKPYREESDYFRPKYWEGELSLVPYIWYADLIDYGFPEEAEGGNLIFGGGGIFHGRGAVEDLLKVAKQAKSRNMTISIKRIGAEYLLPDFKNIVKEILEKACFISVRSSRSAEIIKKLGFNCNIEKDYAFDLDKEFFTKEKVEFPRFEEKRPLIGVVTAGNSNLSRIVWMLRILTIKEIEEFPICNFIHIPHVRHYTDWKTNDLIGGEILWSGINIYHGRRWVRYKQLPFPGTVNRLLNAYTKVDGIIGMRYHSFIFSHMIDKPILAVVDGSKAEGYFLDNKRNEAIPVPGNSDDEGYINGMRKFFSLLMEKK